MALPCVVRDFGAVSATTPTRLTYPVHSFVNDGRRGDQARSVTAPANKPTFMQAFLGSHSANCSYGTLRALLLPAMAPTGQNNMGSFVVVTLHRVTPGGAEIRSVVDSLGIDADAVESDRRGREETRGRGQMTHHFTGGAEQC
jgi:hypothetical protein